MEALEKLGYPAVEPELIVPSKPDLGDLSCAVALKLARELKRAPVGIAEDLAASMNAASGSWRLISAVSAHESGYINFRLNWGAFIHGTLSEARKGLGTFGPGGKNISIEHTNVNPNKALHIGHARNLVLGDSLVRIMKKLGNDVQTLNYMDDSGAQVADVIVGLKFIGYSDEPPAGVKFDVYCGDTVYTGVNRTYEKDPALKEKQRLVLQEIEHGDGEIHDYAHKIVLRILADQLKTCWRLGARYDLLNWESHILATGMWKDSLEKMKERGLAVFETEGENKGCWVLKDEGLGDEKVLVRSDGTAVYVAKDIPYAAWKIGLVADPFRYAVYPGQPGGRILWTTTLGDGQKEHPRFGAADLAISVIDARQDRLQQIVEQGPREDGRQGERALRAQGLRGRRPLEAVGRVTGHRDRRQEFVHMAGRKGAYINTDTVLESLKKKAFEETRKRNPEETDVVGGERRREDGHRGLQVRAAQAGPGQDNRVRHRVVPGAAGRDGTVPPLQLRQGEADTGEGRDEAVDHEGDRVQAGQPEGDGDGQGALHLRQGGHRGGGLPEPEGGSPLLAQDLRPLQRVLRGGPGQPRAGRGAQGRQARARRGVLRDAEGFAGPDRHRDPRDGLGLGRDQDSGPRHGRDPARGEEQLGEDTPSLRDDRGRA